MRRRVKRLQIEKLVPEKGKKVYRTSNVFLGGNTVVIDCLFRYSIISL